MQNSSRDPRTPVAEPVTPQGIRYHSLDAARAFALLLGIVLHATLSFFIGSPAHDVSHSRVLGVPYFVIHTFRMCLFYFIAGFIAHMVFHRRGARAFVKDRAKRILVPMIAGWLVFAPPTLAAVIWGLTRSGQAPRPLGFPLIHLWFLYYLSLFYVLALALRAGFVTLLDRNGALRARIDALVGTGISSYLAPIALAAPIFAVLYSNARWFLWFGISLDTDLMPQAPGLVGYGTAFAFGWVMHRQEALLGVLERQWRVNLVLAIGLTTVCLAVVGITPNPFAPFGIAGHPQMRLVYAMCYTASIWYWTFGIVGAAMRFCSSPSRVRRYLADSSYWVYLGHLPIVYGLQALVMKVPLHWTIKFPAIVAITLAVLLVSYHYLVRPTFIGALLNGRTYPRRNLGPDWDQAGHLPGVLARKQGHAAHADRSG